MKLGIYYGLPEADYHAFEACSNSAMTTIATKSPAHTRVAKKETDALFTGRAMHMAILEPDRFEREVVTAPDVDRRTKEGKAAYAKFLSENDGNMIVSVDDMQEYRLMQTKVWADPTARRLIENGRSEVSIFWEQEGVLCKARFDFISDLGVAVDIKTTRSARPDSFCQDAYKYGYHRQIAWYMRGAKAVGLDIGNMFIVAIEKTDPHPISIFDLDEEGFDLANNELDRLFATYKRCVEEEFWPAYEVNGSNVHKLTLPYRAFNYNPILDTPTNE